MSGRARGRHKRCSIRHFVIGLLWATFAVQSVAVNLKTVRTLGLAIPPSLQQRADQVIE